MNTKTDYIYGKIPVKNALVGHRKVLNVYLSDSHPDQEISNLAKKNSIKVKLVSSQQLNNLSNNNNHQGAIAELSPFEYTPLENLLKLVKEKEDSTIVLLDGLEDPVNFGSIIRSSCAFGVDGIIIGKNRQVQVTGTVSKIATGGEEEIPIVQVVNLSQCIEILKKEGYWIVSAAGEGNDVYDKINYSGKIVLIIGSEGFGVSRLVREHSDFIASIPLPGHVKALNASIACAVFLSQINSYRRNKK